MSYHLTPEGRDSKKKKMDAFWLKERENGTSKWSLTNRPYFMELPEGWEKHKHMNVVPYEEFIAGESFTQQELAINKLGVKLEKTGFFIITPQKPKQPTIVRFNPALRADKVEPIIHFPDNEEDDE